MDIPEDAVLLRIFISEDDKFHGRPLYEAIVLEARNMHLAGATVLRGPMGFGRSSRLHTAKILRLSADLVDLVLAAKRVGRLLDRKLDDVGRTGLILEGFAVDHAHAKLFPMHGTRMPTWQRLSRPTDKYFDRYEGYISSHDYRRANDADLAELARRLRG